MKTFPAAAALTLFVTFVLGALFAAPALAHDTLKSSDPAKGAKVESLDEVRLTFTAEVRFPVVVVRTPDGKSWQDGKPTVKGPVVAQRVKGGLPPGGYVIAYRVVSSDGHPIEGEIPFTLTGGPSPSATASPASPGSAAPPAAAPSSPAAAAPAPRAADGPRSSGGVPTWSWIVVGGVTGVGIGLFLSMRGGKRRS